MSSLSFTKMEGLGNDFVVVDATSAPFTLGPAEIRRLADRHFGVGCDQVLVVEPARGDADFRYRIFNADGSEVEQCGNGARCFVVFVRERGLTSKREIRVETAGGLIAPRLEDDGEVTVDMGVPRFRPEDVPFTGGTGEPVETLDVRGAPLDVGGTALQGGGTTLQGGGTTLEVSVLSMGNPHAVQVVDDVDTAPVAALGPAIEHHARFPRGVNAGFMQIVDRANIRLRVWERGAGETLACGTGACAAVVAGIRRGLLDAKVQVSTRGGELLVGWQGSGSAVTMKGPARTVFEGEWRG